MVELLIQGSTSYSNIDKFSISWKGVLKEVEDTESSGKLFIHPGLLM
jgi:hypothetical protein